MRKILLITVSILIVLSSAGCANGSSGTSTEAAAADMNRAVAAELSVSSAESAPRISIQGSADVLSYMLALSDAYKAEYANAVVDVVAVGREEALEAAQTGEADVAVFTVESLSEVPPGADIAAYACISVIVHPDNEISSLTSEDIIDIFIGDLTNWGWIGGADAEIELVVPDKDVPLRQLFEIILPLRSTTGIAKSLIPGDAQTFADEASVIQAVAEDKNAIGICWATVEDSSVISVDVDGIPISDASVSDGSYILSRPIVLMSGTDESLSMPPIPEFAKNGQMIQVTRSLGLWPIK